MKDRQEILKCLSSYTHTATMAAYAVGKLKEDRIEDYLNEIDGESYNRTISVSLRYLSD